MASPVSPVTGFRFEAPDPDPVVAPQPPAPKSGPAAPAPKADAGDERYEALQREVEELRTSNRDLIGLVGRTAPAPKVETPKADPADDIDWGDDPKDTDATEEDEDPAVLIDDLSKLGRGALAKRGFVRVADVKKIAREESRRAAATAARQIVGKARTEVINESRVMQEFPDLANPESELYKATVPHVRAAAQLDPNSVKNPATLYLAAKAAQAELNGKKGTRGQADEPDDEDDEDNDREPVKRAAPVKNVRDIRIASQAGDRNRSRSRTESGGDNDFVMDSDARQVARMMGISDDEYRAEATRVRTATGQNRRKA